MRFLEGETDAKQSHARWLHAVQPAAQGGEVGSLSLIREYLSGDLNKARGEP